MLRQLKRRFKRGFVKEIVGFEDLCFGGVGGEVKKKIVFIWLKCFQNYSIGDGIEKLGFILS